MRTDPPAAGPPPTTEWAVLHTTALELLQHLQRGHLPLSRLGFIECDCGSTFWLPESVALSGPVSQPPQDDWCHRLIELSDRYRNGYGDISEMVKLFEDHALAKYYEDHARRAAAGSPRPEQE